MLHVLFYSPRKLTEFYKNYLCNVLLLIKTSKTSVKTAAKIFLEDIATLLH